MISQPNHIQTTWQNETGTGHSTGLKVLRQSCIPVYRYLNEKPFEREFFTSWNLIDISATTQASRPSTSSASTRPSALTTDRQEQKNFFYGGIFSPNKIKRKFGFFSKKEPISRLGRGRVTRAMCFSAAAMAMVRHVMAIKWQYGERIYGNHMAMVRQ